MFWNQNTSGKSPIMVNPGGGPIEKKILGLPRKDFFDLALKIIGLSTIILAWMGYINSREEKGKAESDKIQKEYRDSLASLASKKAFILQYFRDSLQLEKENKRNDSDLILKQLSYFTSMESDRKNFEQRNQLFQKQWLNQFEELEKQKTEERLKIFAQTQLDIYLNLSSQITALSEDVDTKKSTEVNLGEFNILVSKVRLLNDFKTYNHLLTFKNCLQNALTYNSIEKIRSELQSKSKEYSEFLKIKLKQLKSNPDTPLIIDTAFLIKNSLYREYLQNNRIKLDFYDYKLNKDVDVQVLTRLTSQCSKLEMDLYYLGEDLKNQIAYFKNKGTHDINVSNHFDEETINRFAGILKDVIDKNYEIAYAGTLGSDIKLRELANQGELVFKKLETVAKEAHDYMYNASVILRQKAVSF